jgi:transketolase
MRAAFAQTLTALAERDPRILLLTGDLGFMALEPFAERFPGRFFNVGVAEQNLVGLATGLAEAGFLPFLYSIAPFASLRPYEFLRNGPVLHRLPVRVVGVGGGFDYGHAGPTHHGLEDVGVLRLQPGLTLIAPADGEQTARALQRTWDLPGPVYYRLGKDDKLHVPGLHGRFELGRAQLLGHGGDLLLIALGGIAAEVVEAAEILAHEDIACTVMVVACLNPAPWPDLVSALTRFRLALTIEAHYVCGGLGSLVAEVIAEEALACRLLRCGVRTAPGGPTGGARYLLQQHGLTSEALAETALQVLAETVRRRRAG